MDSRGTSTTKTGDVLGWQGHLFNPFWYGLLNAIANNWPMPSSGLALRHSGTAYSNGAPIQAR